MQDPRIREMMGKIYRLMEKYERVPEFKTQEEVTTFFEKALNYILKLYEDYKDNPFCEGMLIGLYSSINKIFMQTNKVPIEDEK